MLIAFTRLFSLQLAVIAVPPVLFALMLHSQELEEYRSCYRCLNIFEWINVCRNRKKWYDAMQKHNYLPICNKI